MSDILRPLVVLDVETTGLTKEKDFIIQFAAIKVDRQTDAIIDSLDLYIKPSGPYTITIQAYVKHKIKPQDLEDKPTFAEVADKIRDFIEGCDILTYNGNNFDLPFVKIEFNRIGQDINFRTFDCYDSFQEEKRRNSHSLGTTFERYTGKTMEDAGLTAHNAFSDVKATYEIFKAQQQESPFGPEDNLTEDNVIIMGTFNGVEQPVFNIGKYKELPVSYIATIDKGYLSWCVSDSATFAKSTKEYISKYIK